MFSLPSKRLIQCPIALSYVPREEDNYQSITFLNNSLRFFGPLVPREYVLVLLHRSAALIIEVLLLNYELIFRIWVGNANTNNTASCKQSQLIRY